MLTITEQPDTVQWEAFVNEHPRGNIFQSPPMYALYTSVKNYHPGVLALIDEHHAIKGILLYNIIREPGIKSRFSARSIIMGGPLVADENPDLIAMLIAAYCKSIKKTAAIYTQVRNLQEGMTAHKKIFARFGFRFIEHLDIWIDLTKNEQQLISEMHKKRYANIKRADKKQVTVRILDQQIPPGIVLELMTKTYKRINTPCPPPDLFLNARQYLKEQVVFVVAEYQGMVVACRVYLLYHHTIYDWYAASDLNYAHVLPNDILPWQLMLWAKARNFSIYDFGGAGHPAKPYGVREYKRRFGGIVQQPGRYQATHKPLLYIIGKSAIRLLKYLS